jgi:tetratricopeptide (TPR) repeat protein
VQSPTRSRYRALAGVALALMCGCPSTPVAPEEIDPGFGEVRLYPTDPEHVVEAPPPEPPRYLELARDANERVRAEDFPQALALADEALRVRPFGLEAGLAKVEAHLALGQRTLALDYARRLRDAYPRRYEARYVLGKALYSLGRLGSAGDAFADGVALAPDDRLSRLGLLTALAHDPDVPFDELQGRADDLKSGTPDDADLLHALAMAREIRGDVDAAAALYERAIQLRAHHPFAH